MRKPLRSTVAAAACALAALSPSLRPAVASSAHDNARQIDHQPSTFYWAVLVGISQYAGNTRDLTGSANDARAIRDHLRSIGWRDDHIYVLTDASATKAGILKGIRWLAAKTNNRSAAIFHYSGHQHPMRTSADGDNEAQDQAIRAHDNKFIIDGDLGKELGKVKAARMWIDMSLCRAGGFNDRGMTGRGRVITYSSPESQLSYEDPSLRHSVFSYFAIVRGMRDRMADRNADGKVSVEEAYYWSRSPVIDRTSGKQHPAISDGLSGDFSITPPPPPQGQPQPEPSPTPTPCTLPICV